MRINKLLTNGYELTEEEKANLKVTLEDVIGEIQSEEGYWRPFVNGTNGNLYWEWDTSPTGNTPAQRKILYWPAFSADPENSHLLWKLDSDESWTDLNITTSGAQGPQGDPGQKGADGTSVRLVGTEMVAGGTQVTLGWGTSDTSAFVIPSGAAGANGVSPTVALSEIQDPEYPQGGWNVTITDAEHQSGQTFQIFNGINGQGATVDLVEGNGIQITHQAGTTDYTIGVSADYALKSYANEASANALSEAESWVGLQGFLKSSDLTNYATKTYVNDASAYALSQAETWVGQQNFATSAGLTDDKQFAMTTSGWKEVQGGGGGGSYTAGDGIDITNDVISFDGVVVDAAEQIIAGNGTTENPLSTSSFANALNLELDNINDAISDLADEVAALGGTIVLRGRASCQWLQNIQPSDYQTGDAYIATDSGQISSYNHETGQWDNINVSTGDMVVLINYNNQREVAVLSTIPDLDIYAQKTELPIVEAGANVVVTETTMSTGAKKYTVASLGGGGSSDMAYLVNSNDPRISVTQTYTPSPECKTFTLSANMPHFEAVTAMPSTITPNTYYFVYEE